MQIYFPVTNLNCQLLINGTSAEQIVQNCIDRFTDMLQQNGLSQLYRTLDYVEIIPAILIGNYQSVAETTFYPLQTLAANISEFLN